MFIKENRYFRSRFFSHSKRSIIISFVTLLLIMILGLFSILSIHRLSSVGELFSLLSYMLSPQSSNDAQCHIVWADSFQQRCLPNTFIIGASKSGTTSLVSFLKEVPSVHFVSRGINPTDHHTEVHRFDRPSYQHANKQLELAHEWASSPIVNDFKSSMIIHYTPHYLYAPTVPFEMKNFYPHTKNLTLIILLRDPVERAISSYWFKNSHLFKGKDVGSVDDFLHKASQEMQERQAFELCMLDRQDKLADMSIKDTRKHYLQHIQSMFDIAGSHIYKVNPSFQKSVNWTSPHFCAINTGLKPSITTEPQISDYFKLLHKCFGNSFRSPSLGLRHLDKGIYIDQVLRWLINFGRHQFLIVTTQQLKLYPAETLDHILTYVLRKNKKVAREELQQIDFEGKLRLVRPNKISENHINRMNMSVLTMLRTYYEDYDQALFEMLACST